MTALNPNSIWQNYRLTGVQGHPTNDSTSFNYFLANYVIESDTALADFKGGGIGTPQDGKPNILSNGQRLTMGGCKGCHGVAQTKLGTDFSFLLDQIGKPVEMPDVLLQPNLLQAQAVLSGKKKSKLKAYIDATK